MTRAFHVQIIKPAHYDDEGYVIQWWKASIQSNSLASLYAIVQDAADRQVLSRNVTLTSNGWDECNTVISEDRIAKRIPSAGAGVVFLVGVQTNQFARALDMARGFRACRLPRILYSHAATGIGRPPEAGPARSSGLARRPDPATCSPRACSARLHRPGNRQAPAGAGGSAGTDAGAAARRIS